MSAAIGGQDLKEYTVRLHIASLILCLGALGACAEPRQNGGLTRAPIPASASVSIEPVAVAIGLDRPWGLAFLPDGRFLVTEQSGQLRVIGADGMILPPVTGLPPVLDEGQGGLLDVVIHPDFGENRLVYLSFSEPAGNANHSAVLRGRLSEDATQLTDVEVIFRQKPSMRSQHHFGSRLVFAADRTLYVTLGDRYSGRDQAQNRANTIGKIVRIRDDGSIPADNPFAQGGGAAEIWSWGHRNVQGAALNPVSNALWTHEHGAKGGDEINIPLAGKNYGWPIITYGVDYSGLPIGEGSAKEGLEQPIYYWRPSIAPSGMAFYSGDKYPGWTGDLFVGALAGRHLARLDVEGDRIVGEEKLLTGLDARIRDVRAGPDGFLYVLTDESEGALIRLQPKT